MRNAHTILNEKPEGKRSLDRLRREYEDRPQSTLVSDRGLNQQRRKKTVFQTWISSGHELR
jgi:hypothetical protein